MCAIARSRSFVIDRCPSPADKSSSFCRYPQDFPAKTVPLRYKILVRNNSNFGRRVYLGREIVDFARPAANIFKQIGKP
jgi:hypothetical protein